MLRVLDLFSGIGGFSLGLERTGGFKTVAFCEIDPFCRRVLAKHWPDVRQYEDVRTLTAAQLRADGISVDVICGGFPCQDISSAGKGAGIDGERSGLWREYARLIGELRPAFAIIENVPALRTRGADRVLSDLEEIGYACEPVFVGAVHVGAPHKRQRAWLVAHANVHIHTGRLDRGTDFGPHGGSEGVHQRQGQAPNRQRLRLEPGASGAPLADTTSDGRFARRAGDGTEESGRWQSDRSGVGTDVVADAAFQRNDDGWRVEREESGGGSRGFSQWFVEPDVGRVAHGVPARVDRLRALGNAVVPQIPEIIGEAILASLANGAVAA